MDTFNLKQHVNFATHTKGHTLDLFITPAECKQKIIIESTEILSDHFSVTAKIDFVIPKLPLKTITYRAAQTKLILLSSKMILPNQTYLPLLAAMPLLSISCSIRPCHPY